MRTLVTFIFLLPVALLAQPSDGDLYIPPILTITEHNSTGKPVLNDKERHYFHEMPLLPIVFFDHPGEWTIPERYQMLTGTLQADDYADSLPIWGGKRSYAKYYELLDIVGNRMARDTGTSITLRGGYAAQPEESAEIAIARAETVRDYLRRVWRVAPQRITIAEPERVSDSSDNIFRHEEARRVVIETADWKVIRPVRYAIKSGFFDYLGFRCRISANMPPEMVASITLSVIVNDREAGHIVIPGDPATDIYSLSGVWQWIGHSSTANFTALMIDAVITATDGSLRRANPITIHRETVVENVREVTASRVMLPFFSHRDSTLNGYHKRLLQDVIERDTTSRSVSVRMEGTSEAWEIAPIDTAEAEMYHRRERASIDSVTLDERFPGPYAWTGTMGLLRVRFEGRRWLSSGPDPLDEYIDRYILTHAIPSSKDDSSTSYHCLDTLGIARRDAVAAYLRDGFGMTIVGNSGIGVPLAWERKPPPLLPELRWYERGLSLIISHEKVVPASSATPSYGEK